MGSKRKRESEANPTTNVGSNAIAGPSTPRPPSPSAPPPSSARKSRSKGPRRSVAFSTPGDVGVGSTPRSSLGGSASKRKEKGPKVVFVSSDGSRSWQKHLDSNLTLYEWSRKAIKHLDISAEPQEVRLYNVREGGREVDIFDELDLEAFCRRVRANPFSGVNTIKVYPPSSTPRHQHPTPSALPAPIPTSTPGYHAAEPPSAPSTPADATPTPASRKKKGKDKAGETPLAETGSATNISAKGKKGRGKGKDTAEDERQPQSTEAIELPQSDTGATPKAAKKRKRESAASTLTASISASASSSTTPDSPTATAAPTIASPARSTTTSPSTKPPKQKRQRKGKQASVEPDQTPTAPTEPVKPVNTTTPPLRPPLVQSKSLLDRYKPAKPSPLGRSDEDNAADPTDEPISEAAVPTEEPILVDETPTTPKAVALAVSNESTPSMSKSAKKRAKRGVDEQQSIQQTQNEQDMNAEPGPTAQSVMTNGPVTQASRKKTKQAAKSATPTPAPIAMNTTKPVSKPAAAATSSSRSIPISDPYILHTKPKSPLPHTAKYSSSAISRSPPQPSQEDDVMPGPSESIDLWSDGGAGSPSTSEGGVRPTVESDEEDRLVSSPPRRLDTPPPAVTSTAGTTKEKRQKQKQAEEVDESAHIVGEGPAEQTAPAVTGSPKKKAGRKLKAKGGAETPLKAQTAEPAATEARRRSIPRGASPPPTEPTSDTSVTVQSRSTGPAKATPTSTDKLSSPATAAVPQIKGRGYRAQHARLAQIGSCVICYGPSHLQKDCPRVKAGIESLTELLAERKEEDDDDATEPSVEAIETWIDRLGRIANAVKGKIAPKEDAPSTSPLVPDHEIQAETFAIDSTDTSTSASAPAPTSTKKGKDVPASAKTPAPAPPPPVPALSPARETTHNLPPIHLKALATGKAGSISGLSVSDAVIETEESASDSDDDDDMVMRSPVKHMQAIQAQRADSSGSESESEEQEAAKDKLDPVAEQEKGDIAEEGVVAKTPSTRSRSASASSAASMASSVTATSSSSAPPPDIPLSDSQAALDHFLSMPLSQRQKRAARQSAAAMQDIDLEEEVNEASEVESDDESPPLRLSGRGRRGSESSVGEFQDEDEKEDEDDEVLPFSQPPALLSSQAAKPEEEQEGAHEEAELPSLQVNGTGTASESRTSSPSKRSFTNLAALASPSPINSNFPGDIALQEAIREDEMPLHPAEAIEPKSAGRIGETPGHVISQGLISPPSSNEELSRASLPLPATQMVPSSPQQSQSRSNLGRGRRASQQSQTAKDVESVGLIFSQQSVNGDGQMPLQASQISPIRRRLRSASRELPDPAVISRPTTTRGARRASSQSQISDAPEPSQTSSVGGVRRSSRRTTPVRSSQVDQLDSSQSRPVDIPEDVQGEAGETGETGEAGSASQRKTPLVPETQLSADRTPTQRSPRAALGQDKSPLFMSQGSQIQPTQAYNLFPPAGGSPIVNSDPITPAPAEGDTPRQNGNALGIGIGSSPLSRKDRRKNSVRVSSPILEEDIEGSESEVEDAPTLGISIWKSKMNGEVDGVLQSQSDNEADAVGTVGTTPRPKIPKINGHTARGSDSGSSGSDAKSKSKSNADSDSDSNSNSNSDSEKEAPSLPSSIPIPIFRSQPHSRPYSNGHSHPLMPPLSSFPTLSSLPREALRKKPTAGSGTATSGPSAFSLAIRPSPDKPRTTRTCARKAGGSQPTPKRGQGGRQVTAGKRSLTQPLPGADDDESSSGSSSSDDDDEVQAPQLRGRYAGRRKSTSSTGRPAVRGW